MGASGELKTKPTQHSVKELLGLGIQPDIIIGRSKNPLDVGTKKKIALFCGVEPEKVISDHDIVDIYQVGGMFLKQNVGNILL